MTQMVSLKCLVRKRIIAACPLSAILSLRITRVEKPSPFSNSSPTLTSLPTASLAIPNPATPVPQADLLPPVSPTVAAAMTSTSKPITPTLTTMGAVTATVSSTLEQVPKILSAPILNMAATATVSNTLSPISSAPTLTTAAEMTLSTTQEPVPSIPSAPTLTAAATGTVSNPPQAKQVPPIPDPATTATNMQKKSQTTAIKKGSKMRPNSSSTPRYVTLTDVNFKFLLIHSYLL